MWEAGASAGDGVIFDDTGEGLPPHPVLLAHRLGCPAADFDVVARTIAECGFVWVGPLRDALLVKLAPQTVHPLAAFAAFYEIAASAPKRLILAFPGDAGNPEQYEIFTDPIDGLKRMERALAREAAAPLAPIPRRTRRRRRLPGGVAFTRGDGPVKTRARAGDFSERLSRPLESIGAPDEWLGELLRIWRSAGSERRLPSLDSLDSLELLNIARGRAHIVDTRDTDPEGYRFRLWGTVNSYGSGHANKTLGDMPPGLMRDNAVEDYRRVVATGLPSYQLIHHLENRLAFSYARLVLPLAANGKRVDRLIVLINERLLAELEAP